MRGAVIVAIGATAALQAAKAATSKIPILFASGGDAFAPGLVKNFRRPEANVTGMSFNQTALVPKRVELVRQMVPTSAPFAYLPNAATHCRRGHRIAAARAELNR
jgi:putative ABC transport system substrate-binding protein